ncbi:hypothetical protein NHP164001_20980 [Helicobacter trogontum]|uniref:Uncharacterized protein n=1 Tax=Helicobacter trogontum TaxID=50960 RepID=A0ABQ0D6U5_9HELI
MRDIYFFGGIYCIIIGTQKYLSRDDNSLSITIALLVLVVMWFVVSPLAMYKTLNIKSIFLTSKNLIIQRYIGDKIVLPLGSFYIDIVEPAWLGILLGTDTALVTPFIEDKIVYDFEVCGQNIENLDKLFEILKPHITEFVCTLNDDEYEGSMFEMSYSFHNIHSILYKSNKQFDMNEIEKLREERNAKSNLQNKQ